VNGTAAYDVGAFGANVVARYTSGGKYNTTYVPGDIDPRFADVASMVTFDVGARFRMEAVGGMPELYLNVANVFDRAPPLAPAAASLIGFQTTSTLYDTMGRYYTAGIRLQF
jgi:iron complex outermembrane receptor protein